MRAAYVALPIEACARVRDRNKPVPRHAQTTFGALWLQAAFQPLAGALLPVAEQLQRDLDAVSTRDPILRSLRARERNNLADLRAMPVLAEPCTTIEAWVTSGFDAAARPDVRVKDLLVGTMAPAEARRIARENRRALRHLRSLGVSQAGLLAAGSARATALLPHDLIDGVFAFATAEGDPLS